MMYEDAPDSPDDEQRRREEMERKALLMQMQTRADVPAEPPVAGIARPHATSRVPVAPAAPTSVPGLAPPAEEPGGSVPEVGAPAPRTGRPYQSHHGTVSGYLQAAVGDYAPTVQGGKNEAEAKSLSENYLRSLIPEIEKRGGRVGEIKGDKIQIDGQWVDVFRDIGGASAPQYLVDDGSGGGASAGGQAPPMMVPGQEQSSLMNALAPTDSGTYQELMRRIQELLGPEATDRKALMAQMVK